MILDVFGKNPAGYRLDRMKRSPHYRNGKFQNLLPTTVMRKGVSPFTLMKQFFNKPAQVQPQKPLPHIVTNLRELQASRPALIWFGHSSYLIHWQGLHILVDPVFSGHASPSSHFVKAFEGSNTYKADDFPDIDILVLTHDHYDHLDFQTISRIHPRVKKVVTALGVGAHLSRWGVEVQKITELDWNERAAFEGGIAFRALPARHFSGRGLVRAQTLWMALVLEIDGLRMYLGGDSGYDPHQFKKAGEEYGSFDLAILECGQYGSNWPHIHMFPEETVQAAIDLKAKMLMPVHWGKFALSTHVWNEPVQRLITAAHKRQLQYVVPMIGEVYVIGSDFEQKEWWKL